MPNMHDFTCCDRMSAFAGRKKITAPRLVKLQTFYQERFKQLGMEWAYQICFFRASKSLHVSSTALNQELIRLMS